MNKKEIMSLVANILRKNEIKVEYEDGICIVYRRTPVSWHPVIFIDDNRFVKINGETYDLEGESDSEN